MKAGLLIIGDEILSGRTQDTNTSWLAKFLHSKGVELFGVLTVSDTKESIQSALKYLEQSKVDLIFTSGGIGPTIDDRTKWVLGDYFKKDVVPSAEAQRIVKNNYLRFGREWSEGQNLYDHAPKDFIVTDNPKGMAPGLIFHSETITTLCAPGVPHELSAMVEEVFWPQIIKSKNLKIEFKPQFSIRTFGIPEEEIFFKKEPKLWEELEAYGKVSSLPHLMGVDIIVSAHSSVDKGQFEASLKKLMNSTSIKENIWQFGDKELPDLILEKLKQSSQTVGFAESCTGGLTSSRITDLSGSSSIFNGSIISYANHVKENSLGVNRETLNSFGAVSEQTALEMAIGARQKMNTDYAISFTGIAGPGGGSESKPVGTVAIGWASPKETGSEVFQFRGDRLKLKKRFSEKGLLILLQLINKNKEL